MFPKEYKVVTDLVTALKLHHFDLTNQIQDVKNLADATKDSISRSRRKLNLRAGKKTSGSLTPSYDLKIWKYEIKC